MTTPPPTLSGSSGLDVLRAMLRERSVLAGLSAMRRHLGRIFQITLPGFRPVVLSGHAHNRRVLVDQRADFLWRSERDPVTRLLRHGVLVEDGESHDRLRALMDPSLQRGNVYAHIGAMWRFTDQVTESWKDGAPLDMLVEMRKIALLILIGTLFGVDASRDLDRIWDPVLRSIDYISPGPWILWPEIPRPGYKRPLAELDSYLYELIADRRSSGHSGGDLLSNLIAAPDMDDGLIRDQLLTMLIAGHDTSTALLSWALHLLGRHPEAMASAEREADALPRDTPPEQDQLRAMVFLEAVIKETLRLYPPIHVGNRRAASDLVIDGCPIPQGERVMVSIYLAHRDPQDWESPDEFVPERFLPQGSSGRPALAYIPFGAGPRNCIGAAFSQVEARVVLGRILQRFRLESLGRPVHAYMGATLEPRPGVWMRAWKKP